MVEVILNAHLYAWSSRLAPLIYCFIAICVVIFHCKSINHLYKSRRILLSNSVIFSIILPCSAICQIAFTAFVPYPNFKSKLECEIAAFGGVAAYAITKWTLYMLLTFRLGMSIFNHIFV